MKSVLAASIVTVQVVALASILVGCAESDTSSTRSCRLNSDCEQGEWCVDGRCQFECREDRDCGAREECRRGQCVPAEDVPCSRNSDCLADEVCRGGYCEPAVECTLSSDCPGNLQCLDGQCIDLSGDDVEPAPDVEDDTWTETDATDTDQPDTQLDTGQPDTPLETAPDTNPPETTDPQEEEDRCPPQSGVYGDICNCAEQCISRLCLSNKLTGHNECTKPCNSRADCTDTTAPFYDYWCTAVPHPEGGTINVCVIDDTGFACDPPESPQSCIGGICVLPSPRSPGFDSICSIPCDSAADCISGYACSPTLFGESESTVCYPVGSACNNDPNRCFSGVCAGAYCTYFCETNADCPSPYSCVEAQDETGQVFLVCGIE